MKYDHADKHPDRPVVFPSDYPAEPTTFAGIDAAAERQWQQEVVENYPSIEFENARREREELARSQMSGPVGQGWRCDVGAQSPREHDLELARAEAHRRLSGGLPDAPDDGGPVAVQGGNPFRFG